MATPQAAHACTAAGDKWRLPPIYPATLLLCNHCCCLCSTLCRVVQHLASNKHTAEAHHCASRHIDRLLILGHIACPHTPLLAHGSIRSPAGSNHPLAGLSREGEGKLGWAAAAVGGGPQEAKAGSKAAALSLIRFRP